MCLLQLEDFLKFQWELNLSFHGRCIRVKYCKVGLSAFLPRREARSQVKASEAFFFMKKPFKSLAKFCTILNNN